MIVNPLLLVLGAGASYPYGFPLGNELRLELCNLDSDESLLRTALIKHANLDEAEIRSFGKSFRLSSIKSIDAFLAKRIEFATIGKLAITGVLLSKHYQLLSKNSLDDDWYLELWNALQSGITQIKELENNNVRIITFNYDYSLEVSLHRSIVHTFGVSNEDAFLALQSIPILHVYGCIKNLDSAMSLTNQTLFNAQSIKSASEGIKIIPESRENDSAFIEARKWFSWASNICFLGFGFDELNITRLNMKSVIDSINRKGQLHPRFVASTFGMTLAESELARSRLGLVKNWNTEPRTNLSTIRQHIEIFT